MRCCSKILCISYEDHVTKEEVHAKIQQAVRPHEDLLTIVQRCKLQWYGQVWPKPSCKAQWEGEEDKVDRGWGGKTTSGNGQGWSLASPSGQCRTKKNGGNWLWSHLWYPIDPHGFEGEECAHINKLSDHVTIQPLHTWRQLRQTGCASKCVDTSHDHAAHWTELLNTWILDFSNC